MFAILTYSDIKKSETDRLAIQNALNSILESFESSEKLGEGSFLIEVNNDFSELFDKLNHLRALGIDNLQICLLNEKPCFIKVVTSAKC